LFIAASPLVKEGGGAGCQNFDIWFGSSRQDNLKGLSHQFELGQKWYGWKEKK
jgi:hypothetical protein